MGTPKWVGNSTALIEQPGSPVMESAEKWTRTRVYKGAYSVCLASAVPKGALGSGTEAGFIVAKCSVVRDRGFVGTLTIVYEAGDSTSGAELPPVKFSCDPQRISRPLKYHPKYAELAEGTLEAIEAALTEDITKNTTHYSKFSGIPLAMELFNKRRRGQETYYLAGLKYSYTESSWTLPALTLGGFLETPGGPMEGLLPADTGWLREADDVKFDGSYYTTTRSWIGTPGADWDADLY